MSHEGFAKLTRWDRGHEWEFGAFAGGWAAFTCARCGCSSLDFFTKWRRCRGRSG